MKLMCSSIAVSTVVLIGLVPGSASAQNTEGQKDAAINQYCPITNKAIDGETFMTYRGNNVGFCCGGCDERFMGWDAQRRDAYIIKALAKEEPGLDKPAGANGAGSSDEELIAAQLMHYPIDTCIVGGGPLGSMGEPVNYLYEGRLVRFCCNGCVGKFEAEPATFIKALDQKIVASQIESYPLTTCVIGGGDLGSMGEPINYFYQNRLVRFCCGGCVGKFEADPDAAMAKIDAAYADQQRADYPLDTCVVMGNALDNDDEVVEIVVGNQLVRLCCSMCVEDIQANPSSFIQKINDARK